MFPPKLKIKPYQHQLVAMEKSLNLPNMALWWEMGTGKSKAIVEILKLRYYKAQKIQKTLIFAPIITLQNWKNEFAINSDIHPDIIHVLRQSGKKRKDFLKNLSGDLIVIVNYEALITKEIPGYLLKWQPDIVVCDEAHLIKNPRAIRSTNVGKIAKKAKHRYLLSGTPMLNSPIDLFFPYKVLDGGQTFGENFFAFRSKYFYDENAHWKGKHNYWPSWAPREDMYDDLSRKIKSISMRKKKEDCLDLPKIIKKIVRVDLTKEQRKIYDELEREFVAFITDNDAIMANLAITKSMKMRQIISGFALTDNASFVFPKNPRLDALHELLEQAIGESKVIVWACFKAEHYIIGKMLRDKFKWTEGREYVFLTGQQNETQKNENMNHFRNEKTCRVVVASQMAAGYGINLVEANVMIYYSRTYSRGDDEQSEARCHRSGSEMHKSVLRIDLLTNDSIDEVILEALHEKKKVASAIIDRYRG